METIKMYRADGTGEIITAHGKTLENAILNAGRKFGVVGGKRGYRGIGNMNHIEGGSTYHVQFGTYLEKLNSTTLSSTFVVQHQ